MKKQKELIEKQKEEQKKMMELKKEEANKLAQEKKESEGGRLNVMEIEVGDDFDVDEI